LLLLGEGAVEASLWRECAVRGGFIRAGARETRIGGRDRRRPRERFRDQRVELGVAIDLPPAIRGPCAGRRGKRLRALIGRLRLDDGRRRFAGQRGAGGQRRDDSHCDQVLH
jgi:hypothetical protein